MLSKPMLRCGSFSPLSSVASIRQYEPFIDKPQIKYQLKRKSLKAVPDDGLFVLPLKTCFLRNPRLSSTCKIMLSLLMGWNGAGGSIKTTMSTIGKHIARTRRTIFTLIQEAQEEGYLTYSRLKSREGYYIGIKIFLNTMAIRKQKFKKNANSEVSTQTENKSKTAKIQAVNHCTLDVKKTAQINRNILLNKEKDEQLMESLARFAVKLGYLKNPDKPT